MPWTNNNSVNFAQMQMIYQDYSFKADVITKTSRSHEMVLTSNNDCLQWMICKHDFTLETTKGTAA